MNTTDGRQTITGIGPSLEALFKALGIENMASVHEVTFVDYAENLSAEEIAGYEKAAKARIRENVDRANRKQPHQKNSGINPDDACCCIKLRYERVITIKIY